MKDKIYSLELEHIAYTINLSSMEKLSFLNALVLHQKAPRTLALHFCVGLLGMEWVGTNNHVNLMTLFYKM